MAIATDILPIPFRVTLSRVIDSELVVEVDADSAAEAERLAKEQAEGSELGWVVVNREVVATVEAQ